MKKVIMLVLAVLFSFSIFIPSIVFSATATDYIIVLENISNDCKYGRHLIFRDTNDDGEYDTIRKTNCDGTYSESPMSVSGNGNFDRPGAHGIVISGDIDSDEYTIKVYFPKDNTILGYIEKKASIPVVIFTFQDY